MSGPRYGGLLFCGRSMPNDQSQVKSWRTKLLRRHARVRRASGNLLKINDNLHIKRKQQGNEMA